MGDILRPVKRIPSHLALLVPLILAAVACHEKPRAHGPLRQEAYVWQRSWSPAVRESIAQAGGFAELAVLAAEVDFEERPPEVTRIPLDAAALKGFGKPVGVALRVQAFPGRFADDPAKARFLEARVRGLAAEARAKGIPLAEIQIDYDCPELKLDDYRGILPSLRRAARPVKLTFTALPTWMRQRRAFRQLIAQADGYVLQVHSLEPALGEEIAIIRPDQARVGVENAAGFGRPFRVALPTYGYKVAFDAQGKLIGLLAEGPMVLLGEGVTVRQYRTDPKAMADLVRGWTRDRPQELSGIVWYRLPVADDRLNWTWPTLRSVMAGQAPQGKVSALLRNPQSGLVEIDLLNDGQAEIPWPASVRIGWKDDTFLAADGLAGYSVRREGAREARLVGSGRAAALRPGERRVVAWLRFKVPTEVHVELPQNAG
jgi:hypothetical protein